MAIQIPKRHIPTLAKIQLLSDDDVDRLKAALEVAIPKRDAEEMALQLASMVPGIPPQDLVSIIDTVYSLYHVREFSEVSNTRFLNDLVHAMRTADLLPDKQDVKEIRGRLQKLLGIENIRILSKALKLQREGERLFCGAQILSDLRSIFSEDVGVKPSAAVVSHTLKLSYHEHGQHKEFFVILEKDDLEALKEVVERAQAKEETLGNVLEDAGIQNLSA